MDNEAADVITLPADPDTLRILYLAILNYIDKVEPDDPSFARTCELLGFFREEENLRYPVEDIF